MKIGIVCDNYKLERFKEELSKAKMDFKIHPLMKETSTIQVIIPDQTPEAFTALRTIKDICHLVEIAVKQSN